VFGGQERKLAVCWGGARVSAVELTVGSPLKRAGIVRAEKSGCMRGLEWISVEAEGVIERGGGGGVVAKKRRSGVLSCVGRRGRAGGL